MALFCIGIAALWFSPPGSGSTVEHRAASFAVPAIRGVPDEAAHEWIQTRSQVCVAEAGAGFVATPFDPEASNRFDSRELRSRSGYGYVLDRSSAETIDNTEDSPAQRIRRECESEATRQHQLVLEGFFNGLLASEQQEVLEVATFAHPAFRAAEASWAKCMKDRGFPGLSGPASARQRAAEMKGDDTLLGDEIAISLADWDCANEPRVVEPVAMLFDQLDDQFAARFNEYRNAVM